jgi:uncharacterized protein YjbI with pentapeptide repeats/lysophospholipase L1-like esterase
MKIILFSLFASVLIIGIIPSINAESVPDWVKNTAGWWATDVISETEFVNAIEFLVKDGIIEVDASASTSSSQGVPDWVKNTAGWWATDVISETEFVNAIEFLVKNGIIEVENVENTKQNFIQDSIRSSDLSFLRDTLEVDADDSKHSLNFHGFRGPEVTLEKPPNTYRVFVVGGSTTYGAGVIDSETISSLLQKKFNESDSEQSFEIINAGISAGKASDEAVLIKEKLSKFSPDLIIVYDGWNDMKSYYGNNFNPEKSTNSNPLGAPTEWKNTWVKFCNDNKNEDYDVIVTLQPFLGMGNKIWTHQEESMNTSYQFTVRMAEGYSDYVSQLGEINQNCYAAYDLKNIFDNHFGTIYWDYVHVGKTGNEIVSNVFYEIINDKLQNKESEINKFSTDNTMKKFVEQMYMNERQQIKSVDWSGHDLKDKNFAGADFRNVDLSGADLRGANLSFTLFAYTNLSGADLTGADLGDSKIKNSDFTGANLTDVYAGMTEWENVILRDVTVKNANFMGTWIGCDLEYYTTGTPSGVPCDEISGSFNNVNLSRSTLTFVDMESSEMDDIDFIKGHSIAVEFPENMSADFSGAALQATKMQGDLSNVIFGCYEFWCTDFSAKEFPNLSLYVGSSNLSNADLSNRDFTKLLFVTDSNSDDGVKFIYSDLSNSIFKNVNLTDSDFTGANLSNVDFTGANLSNADLTDANLQGANLSGANLENTNLSCYNHEICK